jgi:hypothetical protein
VTLAATIREKAMSIASYSVESGRGVTQSTRAASEHDPRSPERSINDGRPSRRRAGR